MSEHASAETQSSTIEQRIEQQDSHGSTGEAFVDRSSSNESSVLSEQDSGRMLVIVFCFAILTSIVLVRLVSYQAFGQDLVPIDASGDLSLAPRGTIVDRDGDLLAIDHFGFQVLASSNQIETDTERAKVAALLEELLDLPAAETQRKLTAGVDSPYAILAQIIPLDAAKNLDTWRETNPDDSDTLKNVYLKPIPQRFYPESELASHLLGLVRIGTDRRAHYGIEEYYDLFLRQDGVGLTENRNASWDTISNHVRRFLPSVAGKDLILTIDRTIQWIIEDELRQGIDFYRAHSGTIIVTEPKTGAILGLANWPTYDPNVYGESSVDQYNNPAISSQYEPGSIFKVITYAAALDAGVIEPSTVYTDTGIIVVGGRRILNSNRSASGRVSATDALAHSLNVVTAEIATQVGSDKFYRYVRRYGFGQSTEIDLAKEINGLVKTPKSEDWSLSELGTNSFGQGLAVTPIQMVNAVAAIANKGRLMRPYVVQARIYQDDIQKTQPVFVRQTVRPETAAQLTDMMIQVVQIGNREAQVYGYAIAGKSGTAQIPIEGGYHEDETIVSFVGFAPADDPQFVVLVKLDRPDPTISPWAAYTAAPVFSRVARRLFEHMNIPTDDIRLGRSDR
ncbi:penicillin-binding protein 2 [Chloroflexi bacterium TSY]|nr:penicillin-binding protein 2 [Chloroflexi bacterium TSY]